MGSSPPKPTTTKLPPHQLHNSPSSTLPLPYQNMPLQQAVSYQAFREITNFIRNNGDDWDEFCTKTAHTTRKAKKTPNQSEKQSKHKIAKNEGLLAPEPLLQENPHRFVLFPIQHADIWRMYKKLPSGWQKRQTFQQTSRTGSDCPTPNVTSSLMSLHSLLPPMGLSTRT